MRVLVLVCLLTLGAALIGSVPILRTQWKAHQEARELQAPPVIATDQEQIEIIAAFLNSYIEDEAKRRSRLDNAPVYFDPTVAVASCDRTRSVPCGSFEFISMDPDVSYVDSSDQTVPLRLQMQLEKLVQARIKNPAVSELRIPTRTIRNSDLVCLPERRCECKDTTDAGATFLRISRAALSDDRRVAAALSGEIYCDKSLSYAVLLLEKGNSGWKVKDRVLHLHGE